ncbi:hypothetical protein ABZ069_36710 [Streptomyces microflavus]|uniref:hypothetical protein n=1 Tax=Streptomyces microflavus TaxID=1919 RepID=UPI0033AB59C0
MADFIIRTGDTLLVTIPGAIIPSAMAPVPLRGAALKGTAVRTAVCLEGDELPTQLKVPLLYTTPVCTIPGTGTLTLTLGPTNKSSKLTCEGKAVLLKGGSLTAKFDAGSNPAKQPSPTGPIPDPMPVKNGTAVFITTNAVCKAG